jgi:aspartokinase/homoserine dehydrogenase 1
MDIMGHVRHEIFTHAVGKGVLVDMTASDTYDTVMEFIDQGYHIVLANKRPLTASFPRYQAMLDRARAKGVALMHEATVGAGLPVLDTIAKLQASGDKIYTVLGCLSGTLGYISNELSQGTLFSNAVAQAWRQGYTEPHPADDLSGMDVARKALILARKLGMNINLEDIDVNPLFPAEIYCENPQDFLDRLKQLDSSFAALVQDAAQQGNVIRYVARIDSEKVSVGQEFVPVNSPLGRLQGTDNQIVIRTKRYDTNPLIVTGPGAGAEVTAAGVINDVIAIAVSHFGN